MADLSLSPYLEPHVMGPFLQMKILKEIKYLKLIPLNLILLKWEMDVLYLKIYL